MILGIIPQPHPPWAWPRARKLAMVSATAMASSTEAAGKALRAAPASRPAQAARTEQARGKTNMKASEGSARNVAQLSWQMPDQVTHSVASARLPNRKASDARAILERNVIAFPETARL